MSIHVPPPCKKNIKSSLSLCSPPDESRRRFLVSIASILGGYAAWCALKSLWSSFLPNRQTRQAGGPVRVDLSTLRAGQQLSVLWRGKPVWIIKRTPEMLASLNHDPGALRDPLSMVQQQPSYATNLYRAINPEYLVLVGLCTHLGCSPRYEARACDKLAHGGFYCPCHGSCFDLSGRVFKHMPAPVNLVVPPYRFITPSLLEIGEDHDG